MIQKASLAVFDSKNASI